MKKLLSALVVVSALCLTGCQNTKESMDMDSMAAMNTSCPVSGEPIDAEVTRDFDGQTVSFCCNKCGNKFEKMSMDEKKDMLAAMPVK